MRSKTGFFSRSITSVKPEGDRYSRQATLLDLILHVGPWLINDLAPSHPLKKNKYKDFLASSGTDLASFIRSLPDSLPQSKYLYYRIGDSGFIRYKSDKEFTKNAIPAVEGEFNKALAKIFEDAGLPCPLLLSAIQLAEHEHIKPYADNFSESLKWGSRGFCNLNGEARQIDTDLDLRWGNDGVFAIYEFELPRIESKGATNHAAQPAPAYPLDLLSLDYHRCRLPKLAPDILTDNTQGHWDLYWPEGRSAPAQWYQSVELETEGEARNPVEDIQKSSVGIDFGTASTVVAVRDRRGRLTLVRIGADDFRDSVSAKDYENPTALLFEDLQGLLTAWQGQPWRPLVNWEHVKCSHQAVADASSKMASFLDGIKTWAKTGARPVALKDSASGDELTLTRIPELPAIDIEADFAESPINPVELYAWFIGLRLNNQVGRSEIYTDYHLTFPAGFDRNTRDFILASFRRGLLRSLPASMIYGAGWDYTGLRVREAVSEPAAYAAAALAELDESNAVVVDGGDSAKPIKENTDNMRKPQRSKLSSEALAPQDLYAKIIVNSDSRTWPSRVAAAVRLAREKGHLNFALNLEEIVTKASRAKYGARDIMPHIETVLAWLPGLDPEIRKAWEKLIAGEEDGSAREISYSPDKKAEKLIPTETGAPFGIFDFGGGTADFAIGLYRLPTREEADLEGWQDVIEILETGSDIELGGEHLLARLAFFIACANMPALIKEDVIPFAPPPAEPPVPGGEEIFVNTVIARANTRKLMEILRPFWEGKDTRGENSDQLAETFRAASGKDVQLNLACDRQQMRDWLEARITAGVGAFFSVYRQALARLDAKYPGFHILLAGNASQHPLVMASFRKLAQEQLAASNQVAAFYIHPPAQAGASFSAKTGVAIGILKSLPGETTGIVMGRPENKEASFQYCVWPLHGVSGKNGLIRGCKYGQWVEFSRLNRAGRLIALYSRHPAAVEGKLKRGEGCLEEILEWGEADAGRKVVVKALSPKQVVFGLAGRNGEVESEITLELEEE